MKADEIIARLAAEGELDSEGGFTLDPEVALEKLREFQLRDPARFVLSWVRAAVLLGATRVEIEIDADDVVFRFDGETLSGADFEGLWSAVVGARGSSKLRACRELALGINGAFTWQAKAVTVKSGAEQVGFDPSFAMTRAQLEQAIEGTLVHAKRPLGWSLIRRRLLDARGELPEELLLAEACAHAGPAIVLEGVRLNPAREPQKPEQEPWIRLHLDEDEQRGSLCLRPGERSRLRVLVAGVEVALVELGAELGELDGERRVEPLRRPYLGREAPPETDAEAPPDAALTAAAGLCRHGFLEVLVDDPLLPLDLAQEKIVDGPRWRALLDCVSRLRWRAWFTLATREGWPAAASAGSFYTDAQAALRADLFACPDLAWLDAPGASRYINGLELPRAVADPRAGFVALGPPLGAGLHDTPAIELPWPAPAPKPLTLGELIQSARERGQLFVSPRARGDLAFDPALPVLLGDPPLGLRELGLVWLDRPAKLARYREALAEVRELAGERELGEGWVELRWEHEDLRVRVAWRRGSGPCRGALVLGRAGKRLAEFHLPERWGPLWAQIEGPLEGLFEELVEGAPRFDHRLAAVLLALLERYHDLLAKLVGAPLASWERELITAYLREASGRWSALRLAEITQIPVEYRARALADWRGGWGAPPQWVEPPPDERAACDHPLMRLPWLERHGEHLSLRAIGRELALAGSLVWVERGLPFDAELPAEVWRLAAHERAILADLFHGALTRYDLHAAERAEPGTHALPRELENARRSVELIGLGDERGILGLPRSEVPVPWARPPGRGARLLVLQGGHELGWMDLPLPVGPFYGLLELARATPLPHTHSVAKDGAWRAAAALVEAGARELARAQLDAWIAGELDPADPARVTQWTLDLERGGWPELAAAWRSWQAGLPAEHPLRVDLGATGARA